MQVLQSKSSSDATLYKIDFSSLLPPGAYLIGTPTASKSVWSGLPDISTPLVLAVAIDGGATPTAVWVKASAGQAGNIYKINTTAQASNVTQLTVMSYIPVVDDPI
jgi:hypothetical protein